MIPNSTECSIYPLISDAVSELLPPEYRHYEPAAAEAFAYFLERLSPKTLRAIQTELMSDEAEFSSSKALTVVMRHSPTLHKLGQIMARDSRLTRTLRLHLQELESFPVTLPPNELQQLASEALGADISKYRLEFDVGAALEASVAYVIPTTWVRPGAGRRERAMIKILKPGLGDRLSSELSILGEVAALLDGRCEAYGLPPIEYQETFEAVRELLEQECDLTAELQNLSDAWSIYRGHPDVQVPRPLPFSNPKCIAMRFIPGVKITTSLEQLSRKERSDLAKRLGKALICDAIFSTADSTVIHGDPHAGNLFRCPDGRIGVLDWSLIAQLDRSDREALLVILMAAASLNKRKLRKGLKLIGILVESNSESDSAIDASLAQILRGKQPGIGWLIGIFDALLKSGVVFPSRLAMLRKNLFTLRGVLKDIDPHYSLEREFAKQAAYWMAREFPRRIRRQPFARDYALPIATTDFVEFYGRLPITVARLLRESRRLGTQDSERLTPQSDAT